MTEGALAYVRWHPEAEPVSRAQGVAYHRDTAENVDSDDSDNYHNNGRRQRWQGLIRRYAVSL